MNDGPTGLAPPCIVCGGSTASVRLLPQALLLSRLAAHFPPPAPDPAAIDTAYDLRRCGTCTLEFGWPMRPGNSHFYRWVTQQPNYYPTGRWEWDVIREVLQQQQLIPAAAAYLEIGCGSGYFLEFMRAELAANVTGIDATRESAEKAAAKGFTVFNGELAAFRERQPDRRFDAVFSFHCLEHVEDPVTVLADAARMLKDDGTLFISVPMSPSDYESRWFDPLNNPPHHMTRWNPRSLEAMAQRLGMSVSVVSEPPEGVLRRALHARQMQLFGCEVPTRAQRWSIPLRSPLQFIQELALQRRRSRIGASAAGNILLAQFRAR